MKRLALLAWLLVPALALADPIPSPPASTGSGEWTDSGNTVYPSETADEIVVGANTPVASAKFSIDGDTAAQIQAIIQAATSQSVAVFRIEDSAGANPFTVDQNGDVRADGTISLEDTATCLDPASGDTSICTNAGDAYVRDTGGTTNRLQKLVGSTITIEDTATCTDPASGSTSLCFNTGRLKVRDTGGSTLDVPTTSDILGFQTAGFDFTGFNLDVTSAPAQSGFVQPNGGANIGYSALDFDQTTVEYAYWRFPLPKSYSGGSLEAKVIWTANSASTNGVVWQVACLKVTTSNGFGTSIASGTAGQSPSNAHAGAAHRRNETAWFSIGDGGSATAADVSMNCRVSRLPADAGDTLAADARGVLLEIRYPTAALNDN